MEQVAELPCYGPQGMSVPRHAHCGEGGLGSPGWQDLDKPAVEEEGMLLWHGTPGPALSWEGQLWKRGMQLSQPGSAGSAEARYGREWYNFPSLASEVLICPGRASNGRWGAVVLEGHSWPVMC